MADTPPIDPATAADSQSAAVVDPASVAAEVFGQPGFMVISRYRDILASRGIEWGLLGPREVDRLWSRHILNSANVATLVPRSAAVADVGSGAGLPGIPVAVLRPDLSVELVEPLLRRSNFLTQCVAELRLGEVEPASSDKAEFGSRRRVTVRRARAEEITQRYDVVLSRALAPLDRLIRWCRPLLVTGGQILAIKGASAADEVATFGREIAAARLRADVVRVSCDPRVEASTVVRLKQR